MSFINSSYFENEINIPIDSFSQDIIVNNILRYENEILKYLLGYQLWDELINDLDPEGDPQTQKFVSLVDGSDFSFDFNGNTINTRWEGFRNIDKISLISYYVYYKYRKDNDYHYSGNSQTEPINENSKVIPYAYKLSNIWNLMIRLYGETPNQHSENYLNPVNPYFSDYYYSNNTIKNSYDNFFLNINNYIHFNILPSAYNFLLANKEDYPNWIFAPLQEQNMFGI